MKIFVAGGTGVLGKRAVKQLVDAGHDVTTIGRTDEKAKLVRHLGAEPVQLDVFDRDAVLATVAGYDVVMNLATHIPAPSKSAFKSAWRENDRLRTEGSLNLVDAAIASGAQRYVQESIAFFYPDAGDAVIDESSPIDLPEYAASTAAAEAQAARFTASSGIGIVLRFGMFYASDTAHTKVQLRTARAGLSPFFGPDNSFQPLIQLDDAASAVVAALRAGAGTYNVVDTPMLRGEANAVLAKALGKKRLRQTPKAMLALGGGVFKHLTRSVRVSNAKFIEATGWEPRYPSFREGVASFIGTEAPVASR